MNQIIPKIRIVSKVVFYTLCGIVFGWWMMMTIIEAGRLLERLLQ